MICSRAYQAWTCCLFILIPWLAAAAAEINAEPIVVGVFEDPPFVMVDSRNITGMAVDIWEEALHNINTGFVYKIYDDLPALFIAVQNGEAAAAAANISATAERALRMRLTFPWYDSGLAYWLPIPSLLRCGPPYFSMEPG